MIAAFLMLCQIAGAVSIGLLTLWALASAARIIQLTWREYQLAREKCGQ